MPTSIPASQLVNVIPGVLGAQGNPLSLNGIFVDTSGDTSIPVGTVQAFASLLSVQNWYGAASNQAALAAAYFGGFIGANKYPGLCYFVQAPTASVAAYLRGGTVSGMSIAQLQALSGTIIVTVNGEPVTSSSINLSAATSFSNAATLITTGLDTSGDIFSGTGSQALGLLTISAVSTGTLHVGDTVTGAGVFGGSATISSFGTGTGGTGTYNVSTSGTATSGAVLVTSGCTCTYDSLRQAFLVTSPSTGASSTMGFATGTLSAGLNLTSALGAVTSQGAVAAVPATLMNSIIAVTQNWGSFTTTTEPVLATKLAYAAWVNSQSQRYKYVCFDSDVTPKAGAAPNSFGGQVVTLAYNGVVAIWNPSGLIAAFNMGATASIDFNQAAGRITFAGRGQAGLVADVTDLTTATNLLANGYDFYGSYATATQLFTQYQNGSISGIWLWDDAYVNQIYFNSQFQLALMNLLAQMKSIPYNRLGYNIIRAALMATINQMRAFGALQPNVALSPAQIAEVNQAVSAGSTTTFDAATPLQTAGWFLQVSDPGAQVRQNRGSPACIFYYNDGGAVQQINLSSIDVQ